MKKKKGKINLKLTLSPIEGHILDFIAFSLGGRGDDLLNCILVQPCFNNVHREDLPVRCILN